MKHLLCLSLILCFLLSLCSSVRLPSNPAPHVWTSVADKHSFRSEIHDSKFNITVALTQRNLDTLEDRFWAVSDPKNPNYGQHMSFSEVVSLVAPAQSSIDTVVSWFRENGIESDDVIIHQSRDFLTVTVSVSQAETLFQTSCAPYVNKRNGMVAMRMEGGYELPDRIYAHVEFVTSFNVLPNVSHAMVQAQPVRRSNALAKPLQPFPVPEKKSRAVSSSMSSSTPIYYQQAATNETILPYVATFCTDGSSPTLDTSSFPCKLTCATGPGINYVTMEVLSAVDGSDVFYTQLTCDYCFTCSSESYCTQTWAPAKGLPTSTVMCGGSIPVDNYSPIYVTAQVLYLDASLSGLATSFTVEASEAASPAIIDRTYSIPAGTTVTNPRNNQSAVGFLSESFNATDIQTFLQYYGLGTYAAQAKVINPNYNSGVGTSEASLDMQSLMGVARNCPTYFWATPSTYWLYNWITDVLNSASAPLVHSVSYAEDEYLETDAQRVNTEFMKAGVRGITLVVSSGDDGVYAHQPSSYSAGYTPQFPASSPYVTTVGATQLYSKTGPCYSGTTYTCSSVVEVVCSPYTGASIGSGGGFSNVFARPSYQDAIVSTYLAQYVSGTGFNTSGRAYPDVAMLGHNVPTLLNGVWESQDGTSASAPFFAAFVTLLNDIRLNAGQSPLGFLNPFIYSLGTSAFNDVTRGTNNCAELLCPGPVGFSAVPGYDAATGLGSPIFTAWAAAVASMGGGTPSPTSSPTSAPTRGPTPAPTKAPTGTPTSAPSPAPTTTPTKTPTTAPSRAPTSAPTSSPSKPPTSAPSPAPTSSPSKAPTTPPSGAPTNTPTKAPTTPPSGAPSSSPTTPPSGSPSGAPTNAPTKGPSSAPTNAPTQSPSGAPSRSPTSAPSSSPSRAPTNAPSGSPSGAPTNSPTQAPSRSPTPAPTSPSSTTSTSTPTKGPTAAPSRGPTTAPSTSPSKSPTQSPSTPTPTPSRSATPTPAPSRTPTSPPTPSSKVPTSTPTAKSPTPSPTPTSIPSFNVNEASSSALSMVHSILVVLLVFVACKFL